MTHGVSIVIPTWNGVELLKRFLPSIIEAASHYSNQSHAATEIVVVDDASSDGTVAWLAGQGFVEQWSGVGGRGPVDSNLRSQNSDSSQPTPDHCPPATALRFVSNETNRGFGESCNRGFRVASLPLVFLLNNDVEVSRDCIAPLVENFDGEDVFAAHCRVFELDSGRECGTGKLGSFARGFIRVHRSYAALGADERGGPVEGSGRGARLYSMFAGGGSAMLDREKFLGLGGFEPLLSPFYWEDVELSYRAWKRGLTVLYEPRSATRHRVSSTIGKLDRRSVEKVQQRNRLLFHWINLHDGRMLAAHVAWVVLLAITAPLRLKPGFIASLIAALRLLRQVRGRRGEEKRAAKRTDGEVFDLFSALENRADVFAYDDYAELRRGEKETRG